VTATVNEDGNTSMYTIKPSRPKASQVVHYTYSPSPDASDKSVLLTGGGTDSVTVIGAKILISASAPTRKGRAATYWVPLNPGKKIAKLHAAFADNARATDVVSGASVKLHLTDPDSNGVVPHSAGQSGGDYMLDSQADGELIFASGIGSRHVSLRRLQRNPGSGELTPLITGLEAPKGLLFMR
jgi:hypothetical protein